MTWDWGTIAKVTEILTIIGYAVPVIMLFIIPTNRKPSSATAWLLTMLLLPYVGLILYFLIGNPKLPARRQAQQRTATELITATVEQARANTAVDPQAHALLDPAIPERYEPFVALNTIWVACRPSQATASNSCPTTPDRSRVLPKRSTRRATSFISSTSSSRWTRRPRSALWRWSRRRRAASRYACCWITWGPVLIRTIKTCSSA